MSSDGFDKLLAEREEGSPEPTSVKFLRELLGMGFTIKRLSFHRERDHFSLGEPTYFLTLSRKGEPRVEKIEWSSQLEDLLYAQGIRADNREHEASRGAYRIIQGLRLADRKWGKDYTDSVLHELLTSLFSNSEDVQALLSQVSSHRPYQGEAYVACQGYLKKCLGDYASGLMDALGYSREEAQRIFTQAVLQMFDERHHLTLTRLLFTGT